MENRKKYQESRKTLSKDTNPLSGVLFLLRDDNVLEKAYELLDLELTEGQTTKGEKQMFVQGFLQACSWIRENTK
jgi:hypothetical protein